MVIKWKKRGVVVILVEHLDFVEESPIVDLPKEKNSMIYMIVNAVILILLIICMNYIKVDIFGTSVIVVLYFYFFCFQKLLIKADLPWWGAFIPIYNIYLLFKYLKVRNFI